MSAVTLAICGSGNGAHALAGIASSQPNTEVRVLTLCEDKAQSWSNSLYNGDFTVSRFSQGEKYGEHKTKPSLVTNEPGKAIPGCDVITFVLAAFVHEKYLNAIKPYIEPGMILVGLPGQAGFEFQLRAILGSDLFYQITVINYESLPWATRLNEFGRSCDVLGTKNAMMGALKVGSTTPYCDPYTIVQGLLGDKPVLTTKGHLLTVSLMSINAYLHTSILYDKWVIWDGTPLDEKPLSYHGISQNGATLMGGISDEVMSIMKVIVSQSPQTDLSRTSHIMDWYKKSYISDIEDMSSLHTAITTNKAYKGLTHTMIATLEGKWVPDFSHRYITEDIPFGLVVIRGIAEIVGVATPNMDRVITWAQDKLHKKYLVEGKLQGQDVRETRAPQRFGFTTLQDLIGKSIY